LFEILKTARYVVAVGYRVRAIRSSPARKAHRGAAGLSGRLLIHLGRIVPIENRRSKRYITSGDGRRADPLHSLSTEEEAS
jgi:hypothetical protein